MEVNLNTKTWLVCGVCREPITKKVEIFLMGSNGLHVVARCDTCNAEREAEIHIPTTLVLKPKTTQEQQ